MARASHFAHCSVIASSTPSPYVVYASVRASSLPCTASKCEAGEGYAGDWVDLGIGPRSENFPALAS
jgi:hypothetical protein